MTILFIRTAIIYALVILALRLMGKRQLGELQPSELVVAIMISDLATMPMSDVSIPLVYGIVPIFALVICEIVLSFVSLKSEVFRVFITGRPQIIIRNGKICQKELLCARINIDDLMEELRKEGYFSLKDVDTAILETGGNITVIPSVASAPLTRGDVGINTYQDKVSYVFIADGKIRHSELKRSGKNLQWLQKELHKAGISGAKDVFVFTLDGGDNVYVERKDKK